MDTLELVYMKLLLLNKDYNKVERGNRMDKVHIEQCLFNLQELDGNNKLIL